MPIPPGAVGERGSDTWSDSIDRTCRAANGTHSIDILLLVTTGDAQHRWWLCCWGHIFEHDPIAEGDELQCPAFFHEDEPCGTSFVFEPFASRQEALDAFKLSSPRPQWAQWAAN